MSSLRPREGPPPQNPPTTPRRLRLPPGAKPRTGREIRRDRGASETNSLGGQRREGHPAAPLCRCCRSNPTGFGVLRFSTATTSPTHTSHPGERLFTAPPGTTVPSETLEQREARPELRQRCLSRDSAKIPFRNFTPRVEANPAEGTVFLHSYRGPPHSSHASQDSAGALPHRRACSGKTAASSASLRVKAGWQLLWGKERTR